MPSSLVASFIFPISLVLSCSYYEKKGSYWLRKNTDSCGQIYSTEIQRTNGFVFVCIQHDGSLEIVRVHTASWTLMALTHVLGKFFAALIIEVCLSLQFPKSWVISFN